MQCTCLIAPFSGGPRRVRGRNDRRAVDLQHLISGVVQQSIVPDVLASSKLELSVTVVEGHGGVEACAINSAMLAVADAGECSQLLKDNLHACNEALRSPCRACISPLGGLECW